MSQQTSDKTITKSLTVERSVEDAFRIFTAEIGSWWPLATKSVGLERSEALVIECRAGGRVYERVSGGEEVDWGKILVWEPPQRLVFTWHPGRDEETAQEVEVTFAAAGPETRVVLEHRGWERLVEGADEIPAHYESGWDEVLARFVKAAA